MPPTTTDVSTHSPKQRNNDAQKGGHELPCLTMTISELPAHQDAPSPPSGRDKGYGWVVVAAVMCGNTFTSGYIKSFGITYLLLLGYFPDASGAAAGSILGLLVGVRGLLAPLIGALAVKVGPRCCVLVGTLLTTVGLLLATFTFSIYYMAFTLGAIMGVAIIIGETPGLLLIQRYFVEKRSLANAIAMAGNPLGGIIFSPLLVFLNDYYGLHGMFVMLAAIMMHKAVFGMLMRPFEVHQQMLHHQHLRKTHQVTESGNQKETPLPQRTFEFTLFKNHRYLLYLLLGLTVNVALPTGVMYIPSYGDSLGLSSYQTSVIAAYLSVVDCAFRILIGFFVQKLRLNEANFFRGGLLVGGVGCLTVPLCSNLWQLMFATTLFAFGLATFWSLLNTLLANDFGAESMASSWGFFRMVQGISNLIYPSFLGLVKDLTGSLVVPFFIMGGGLISGVIIFSLPILFKICKTTSATLRITHVEAS